MKKRKMRRQSQKNKEDSIPSSILGMIFYTSVYNFTEQFRSFSKQKILLFTVTGTVTGTNLLGIY